MKKTYISLSLLCVALLLSVIILTKPAVADASFLPAAVQNAFTYIFTKLGVISSNDMQIKQITLDKSNGNVSRPNPTPIPDISSFKLHSRIGSKSISGTQVFYSVTGSAVVPNGRFSYWTIQFSCPKGLHAIDKISGKYICDIKQKIQSGVNLEILASNDNDKSQTLVAIGQLLSEKDGVTPIVTDKNSIDIQPNNLDRARVSISIISPNGGETWEAGSIHQIQWTTTNMPLDKEGFIVLLNNGQASGVVTKSVALNGGSLSSFGGSLSWTIPTSTPKGSQYSVRFGIGSYFDPDSVYAGKYFDSKIFTITQRSTPSSPFSLLFGDNVFLAPNDGSLTIPVVDPGSGKGGGTVTDVVMPTIVSKAFYIDHQDSYDFLIMLAPTFDDPGFDGNTPVKNSVQGIGESVNDASSLYGSHGTLKSVVTVYNLDNYVSEFIHEISHQWLMYISDPNLKINDGSGAHWSQFADTATREGGFMYFSPNRGNPFIDNGNGTFSLDSTTPLGSPYYHKFNSMELYLMGLIPASQVTSVALWQTNSTQIAQTMTGTKRMVSVQDIINIVGQRVPAYPNTQRDFKVAYIVLPKKGEVINSVIIDKIKRIVTGLPTEWSFATKGLSLIK